VSVRISELSKVYGAQKALDNVSFDAVEGEILGFLGPNGAGKSTTMKIVTGYIPPTSGKIEVGGYSITEESLEVRKIVGYLPEHNPLYLDMYVHEYLKFIGSLHGLVGKKAKARIDEMIELCGLQVEQDKKIDALSKGYRQRVGLAQSLIHDPSVLILDEPTTGLDPNQIIEVREVIKNISKEKTVIFSTHILQEVKAICDRVVIINRGKIVANDRVDHLLSKNSQHSIDVEFSDVVDIEMLKSLDGVEVVESLTKLKYRVTAKVGKEIRSDLFKFATEQEVTLLGLNQVEDSMEEIFRKLTIEGGGE